MGVEQVTIQNLEVVKVDPELNMIAVRALFRDLKAELYTSETPLRTTEER